MAGGEYLSFLFEGKFLGGRPMDGSKSRLSRLCDGWWRVAAVGIGKSIYLSRLDGVSASQVEYWI